MTTQEFIELYEAFSSNMEELDLFEDYKGYKNYLAYLKATNPEKYEAMKRKSIERNKTVAASSRAALKDADPEKYQKGAELTLRKTFTNILKNHDLIDAPDYYSRLKQVEKIGLDELKTNHPEVLKEIMLAIKESDIDNTRGLQLLKQMFAARTDRIEANNKYTKQRQEHRIPDDPLTRGIKQGIRQSKLEKIKAAKQILIDPTIDDETFKTTVLDILRDQDVRKIRKMFISVIAEIDNDARKQILQKAADRILYVKYGNEDVK